MSILIKGMEKPSCCLMCPMYTISGCRASKRIFPDWMNVAAIPKDCPLVPLPEGHGRLVDADLLMKEVQLIIEDYHRNVGGHYLTREIIEQISVSTTVIEAEGGGEDG